MVNINTLTGIFPTGQMPLDAKRYYLTLAELGDLGALDFKAYYYYDRLRVLVLEDNKEYIWRKEAILNETGGVVSTSFTYPANTIANGIDYSGKIFNFFPLSSSDVPVIPIIEAFGAIWSGVGLTFDCYADPYIIANQVYFTLPGPVTLGASPTTVGNKRKDAIVADVNGNFVVVPGTEAISPEDPDIDEATQRLLTIVLLTDNVSVPPELSEIQLYDENAGEPNEYTASDNGGGTFDLASINNPSKNSIHMEGLVVIDGTEILLTDDILNSFLSMSSVSFDIETPNQGAILVVSFKKAGVRVTGIVGVSPGVFGYQGAQSGYQTIGIPMGSFNITSETFDALSIEVYGHGISNVDLIRFDNIRITYGGDPFADSPNTYLGLFDTDDTNYFGKENYAGLVNTFETGLLLQPIVRFQDLYTGNAIINGGVDFVLDLTRSVWSTRFIVDQVLYDENVRGDVTHDVADANPRWDIYYLEKLTPTTPATVGIKKGTAGVAPEKPGLDDPVKQVKVGEKLFIASEPVSPPEITSDLIYDELAGEPNEWTVTIPTGGVGNSTTGNGSFNGAVHLSWGGTYITPSIWTFDNDAPIAWDPNGGTLTFGLRFPVLLDQFARIHITVIDVSGGISSLPFSMNRNQLQNYGFENVLTPPGSSLDQLWYQISIPTSDFSFAGVQFDRIGITIDNAPKGSMDYIRYNTGVIGGPTETNITDISIQDENQVEQFRVQGKILFEGFTFDSVLKKITAGPSGSGLPIVQKTGLNMVFTEDAFYNESVYLTSGDIIIDGTGAVVGAATWQHCDRYVPNILTAGSEKYRISGKVPSSEKVNIYKTVFNGSKYDVIIDAKSYIGTPTPTLTPSDGQVTLTGWGSLNATLFTIKFNTVDDEGTATQIYSGTGIDLTPDFEFIHTGLTNGVQIFYYLNAFGNGYEDSATGIGNATPDFGIDTFRLYIGGVGGTLTTKALLAAKFTGISDTDISTFTIDANLNVYAVIGKQATSTIASAFGETPIHDLITYFIDLDGFLPLLNQYDFQGNASNSKLKLWYSPTAVVRGSTSASRNFRNRTVNFKLIYVPFDGQIGNAVGDNTCFDILTNGIELFVHEDAETNNGGGVEGDVQDAITNNSAIVTYVTDTVSVPDAVNDMTVSSITATTVNLDFTAPSSTNPILRYEVWVDGAFWDWISATGGTVSGLTTGTNYDIQIKTADNQYNLSLIGNTVNFTTL